MSKIPHPGYYSLSDLPQRGSIEKQAFGSGWWELDRILKFYLGQFIVVTGLAGSGKSTFLLNVIGRLARLHGIKSFMYVPENEAHLAIRSKDLGRRSRLSIISQRLNALFNLPLRTALMSGRARLIGYLARRPPRLSGTKSSSF